MISRKNFNRGNAKAIILSTLLLLALFIMGCTASAIQGKPTEPPISPIPRPATAMSANTPDAQVQPQRLRLTNQSALPLYGLLVIFPNERVDFGDIPAGATTAYKVFSRGVYRYAAYNVEVDGQKYRQPVIDWIGETPIPGAAFTYILEADPTRWKTQGQVIRLVKVVKIRRRGQAAE
jgi:hypothetical protein